MSFFSGISNFVSNLGDFIGNACNKFFDGVSLALDHLSGVAKHIGEGIKNVCDKISTQGIFLIGSVALALLIPGFGLPEILAIIQIVGAVSDMLHVGGKDSPEEIGMKTEVAEKKPDDFDSTEAYIKYLNEEVTLEPGASEKLSPENKVKYGLIGSALDIKAIQEKYNLEISANFLRDAVLLKMPVEEVCAYVKDFSDRGLQKMQDMTDYLRGKPIESEKSEVSSVVLDAMKKLYPEMSDEQLERKLAEMGESLKKTEVE